MSYETENIVRHRCPSNIAIVKYWGKHGVQLPNNPSISFTLSNCFTETSIKFKRFGQFNTEFYFDGKKNDAFKAKIDKFLLSIKPDFQFLDKMSLHIESSNSFPHSSGIASSASSMSALTMCLLEIEKIVNHSERIDLRRASRYSRLASGSASRSVYPVTALWGATPSMPESSDEYAISIENKVHPVFKNYHDTILIVSSKEKSVSSRVGHSLMDGHPMAEQRYRTAKENTEKLLKALEIGDLETFINIAEAEATQLHELMATSNPPYTLLEANTIRIIDAIRNYRAVSKMPVCFTLDAGPNVHCLYPDECDAEAKAFIDNTLSKFCFEEKLIHDKVWNQGPITER